MDHVITRIDRGITLIPLGNNLDLLLDMQMSLECEEYRFGISILVINNFCAIIFFLLQCEFMFLDEIIFIIIDAGEAENTVLDVVSHLLLVNVDSILSIFDEEPVVSKIFERVFAQIIDFLTVWVSI